MDYFCFPVNGFVSTPFLERSGFKVSASLMVFCFFLAILVPCAGVSKSVGVLSDAPESREFKILLLPDNFEKPLKGMIRYWKIATAAAKSLGLKVRDEKELNLEPDRFVTYLDTPGYELKKQGYILRRRGSKPFTAKKWDLVLKARSSDPALASTAPVEAAADQGSARVFFQEDISMGRTTDGTFKPRSLFSKSGSARVTVNPGETFNGFSKIFPGLVKLDIDASRQITPVRGLVIKEFRLKPGKIDLGSHRAAVTITVWRVEGEDMPWVAEFSFVYGLRGDPLKDDLAGEMAMDFCRTLMARSTKWLNHGMTKTSLVYGEARMR